MPEANGGFLVCDYNALKAMSFKWYTAICLPEVGNEIRKDLID